MKRHLLSWSLMATICSAVLLSCSADNATLDKPADDNSTNDPTDVTTSLTLSADSVDIATEGGTYSIDYTLTGGYEGIGLKALCDADWITEVAVSDTTITVTAVANDDYMPREAVLTTRYPGIDDQTVRITQTCDTTLFDIAISNETSTSCISTVTCNNPDMAYIVSLADINYFHAADISTAEELFMSEYNYYRSIAAEYDYNLGQYMFINEIAFFGESRIQWTNMIPNVDHVLYVYGIAFNESMTEYTLATPISHVIVRLKGQELKDVEFDVDVTVNGPEVLFEFEPVGWSGSYYIDVYSERDNLYLAEGDTPSDDYCQRVVDNWLQMINQYMASGYSGTQLMDIMCLRGADAYSQIFQADTRYMMSFYAIELVDGIPQVVSRPYLVHFKTEPVEMSDMTFDVDITNVYTRVADIRVTPSNNDDPYTITLIPTRDIPEGDDEQIINWYITTFQASSFKGEITSHLNTLSPATDYSLLVFGYYGGVITTGLTRMDFTTDPEGVCENSVVRVDFMGPYSPMELAEHYPNALNGMEEAYEQYGYYVMWAEIITEKPSQGLFVFFYEPSELEADMSLVFEDLVSYPSPTISCFTGRSGVEFVMCGVTMDYRGNYSDMWQSEPFTYVYPDNKRPIEELVAKLATPSQTGSVMLVSPDGRHDAIDGIIAVRK